MYHKGVIIHYTSSDFNLENDVSKSINKHFNSKKFFINKIKTKRYKVSDIIPQLFQGKRLIIHMLIKDKCSETPQVEDIRSTLEKLKSFCISNDIHEINASKTCLGMDWETLKDLINDIFKNETITFNIFNIEREEVHLNSDISSVENNAESDEDTAHSADEDEVNGVTYIDQTINFGQNQILF